MKSHDELIGNDGVYRKRTGINNLMYLHTKHQQMMNNKFKERLDNLKTKQDISNEEGTSSKETDKINKNKKRIVTVQGRREDSDSE
ncbi:hypothetical protein GLOIN_2v1869529 [Rhizophagus irregularis DAOM 181602=DAOM 197198]|nr:hypothetical protein GLOIN_2v1869529 [Rhizophagus irregularis DAOM 181602=DAOM 197198]